MIYTIKQLNDWLTMFNRKSNEEKDAYISSTPTKVRAGLDSIEQLRDNLDKAEIVIRRYLTFREVAREVYAAFEVGKCYSSKEIKPVLQAIFDAAGYDINVVGTTIGVFFTYRYKGVKRNNKVTMKYELKERKYVRNI